MVEPINLNKFRKAKAKADKKRQAKENRIVFGATKAEKDLLKAKDKKTNMEIDGKKLDE